MRWRLPEVKNSFRPRRIFYLAFVVLVAWGVALQFIRSVPEPDPLYTIHTICEGYILKADLDDDGKVLGLWNEADYPSFVWTKEEGLTPLGIPPDGERAAYGLSATGEILAIDGYSGATKLSTRLFLWKEENDSDVDWNFEAKEGELIRPYFRNDINNLGQFSGSGSAADGSHRACIWSATTHAIDLGTLGGEDSDAKGLNDLGQVVGASEIDSWSARMATELLRFLHKVLPPKAVSLLHDWSIPPRRPFLWENGQMVDLNSFLLGNSHWILRNAYAINNRGEIVAYGKNKHTGKSAVVFLIPTRQ